MNSAWKNQAFASEAGLSAANTGAHHCVGGSSRQSRGAVRKDDRNWGRNLRCSLTSVGHTTHFGCIYYIMYIYISLSLTNYLRYGLGILDQNLDNMLETLGFDLTFEGFLRPNNLFLGAVLGVELQKHGDALSCHAGQMGPGQHLAATSHLITMKFHSIHLHVPPRWLNHPASVERWMGRLRPSSCSLGRSHFGHLGHLGHSTELGFTRWMLKIRMNQTNLSIKIYPSIDLSIYPSIYLPIYLSYLI